MMYLKSKIKKKGVAVAEALVVHVFEWKFAELLENQNTENMTGNENYNSHTCLLLKPNNQFEKG